MEALDTIINAAVISIVGLLLGLQTRTGLAEVRREIRDLRTELHEEIGALRRELHEEIRSVRSDLTNVALAVGAAPSARTSGSARRPG